MREIFSCFAWLACMAIISLGFLLAFGDIRTINAWGLWFQTILGG